MFFRKSKRIKELERENMKLRSALFNDSPLKSESLSVEKYQAVISLSNELPLNYAIREAKYNLALSLYDVMKIETDYDFKEELNKVRASIRVVKERDYE